MGYKIKYSAHAKDDLDDAYFYYHQISKNVLKKFKKRKSMYFDQVVESGHYQLGIKGKKVLVVYDEDIDDFYHRYINFIQK